jgi:sensor histidine kinase YesM
MLVLRVVNTTAPSRIEAPGGIGLRNVRERLSVHFGERATLTAGSITSGQWIAEVRMPLLSEGPDAKRSSY